MPVHIWGGIIMTLSGTDKVIIGGSAIATAGLLGYGIYYGLSGQAVVSQCECEQKQLFNKYISTLSTYLQQDSANGISITQEQQSNLNYLISQMNAQQNICVEDQKKLSESIDSILGNASYIIAAGISSAIAIYGLSKAYAQIKKKKPPSSGGGKTWGEAVSFITPVVVQDLYSNGKISSDEAEAMSSYSVSQNYEGELENAVQAQVDDVFVTQELMTADVAAAYIAVATDAIVYDMALVSLVLV